MKLFEEPLSQPGKEPLAMRARPKSVDGVVGQEHLLGKGKPLRMLLESKELQSFLIWGPPGCGKTTVALIAANNRNSVVISATHEHIKDVKKTIETLVRESRVSGKKPVLIVDEIQHFNRKEQGAFLEPVEKGRIVLIGLTTENPSFYINSALLSRLRVFVFEKLTEHHVVRIIEEALKNDEEFKGRVLSEEAKKIIAAFSEGDARRALNIVEGVLLSVSKNPVERDDLKDFITRAMPYGEESHYDLISAFIKSMRGSDPDAALYYMYRMLRAGENPLYIARRMVRFASEDIGLADPQALVVANAAKDAFDFLGAPEGYLALAEACAYLSRAKKDNAIYKAEEAVNETIEETGDLEVPLKLRNPVTRFLESLGYGKGYKYPHNFKDHIVEGEVYLPEEIKGRKFLKDV